MIIYICLLYHISTIALNVSDEEIFKSVHEHWQGEEMMEINIIDMPSHWNALAASLILQQYVADLNDSCCYEFPYPIDWYDWYLWHDWYAQQLPLGTPTYCDQTQVAQV
jgi:hypothetical protein